MHFKNDWAVVVPMANEEVEFEPFVSLLRTVIDELQSGTAYFVVDNASTDKTLELCTALSELDHRFVTVWAPENKNVVDAYLKGYRTAFEKGHTYIVEMDAGLSHDPRALPVFLQALNEGNECVFGSRFIQGGSMTDSSFKRRFLSKFGTLLANFLLGTQLEDMTSGYQGFHRNVVKLFLDTPLKSEAHFYQTEIRYLLRHKRYREIAIHYRAPSPSITQKALNNSLDVLIFYVYNRFMRKPIAL